MGHSVSKMSPLLEASSPELFRALAPLANAPLLALPSALLSALRTVMQQPIAKAILIAAMGGGVASLWLLNRLLLASPAARGVPMAPNAHWLFGHIGEMGRHVDNLNVWWAEKIAEAKKATGVAAVNTRIFWFYPALYVSSPELLKAVLTTHSDKYVKQKGLFGGYDTLRPLLGRGLLTSEGEVWKAHRKLANPAFSLSHLKSLVECFARHTHIMIDRMVANSNPALLATHTHAHTHTETSADGEVHAIPPGCVEFQTELTKCTVDIIGEAGMGVDFEAQKRPDSRIPQAIFQVLRVMQQRLLNPLRAYTHWSEGKVYAQELMYLKNMLRDVLREKKSKMIRGEGKDKSVISLLLEAQIAGEGTHTHTPPTSRLLPPTPPADFDVSPRSDVSASTAADDRSPTMSPVSPARAPVSPTGTLPSNKKNAKNASMNFSEEDLMDEGMTFLIAGHETTATTLTWVLYELTQHPLWLDKLRNEVDALMGEKKTDEKKTDKKIPTYDDIGRMVEMDKFIKETLRYYPPIPGVGRTAIEGHWLNDKIYVPKGAHVAALIHPLHSDPALWGEDAHIFNPDRWSDDPRTCTNSWRTEKYHFLPFSAGGRNCIGKVFGDIELKVILALLLHTTEWRRPPHAPPIAAKQFLTLRPNGGLPLVFTRRGE